MKHITLDCSLMTGPDEVHDLFAQVLEFPEQYGRSLDALYGLLSTYPPLVLTLTNVKALSSLFRYGDNLLLAIQDAEQANPALTLELLD